MTTEYSRLMALDEKALRDIILEAAISVPAGAPTRGSATVDAVFKALLPQFRKQQELLGKAEAALITCEADCGFMNDEIRFDYDKVKEALTLLREWKETEHDR